MQLQHQIMLNEKDVKTDNQNAVLISMTTLVNYLMWYQTNILDFVRIFSQYHACLDEIVFQGRHFSVTFKK